MKAAGVQPFDLSVRSGWTPPGGKVQFPQILGNEFAGFRVLGCQAEHVVVSSDQLVRIPQRMPWEVAATLSASGQTAHSALEVLGVNEGETVLVHAAAGCVGTFAVQIARACGATVIGTASESNHEYLRSLGVIPVSYGKGLVDRVREVAPNGVDAAVDAIGGEALEASLELVKQRERIGTIVEFERAQQLGVRVIRSQRSATRLQALVDLYDRGLLCVLVRKTFPLHLTGDAHRELESGHGRGKVAIVIG